MSTVLKPTRSSGSLRETARRRWCAARSAIACLAIVACTPPDDPEAARGPDGEALTTAATLGDQEVGTVSEYLASEPFVSADALNGARLAQVCRACHTLGAGEPALLGPNLHGMFGRRAGSLPEYDYSQALREADFTWTPRALDAWLSRPAQFLPGNRMTFTGVSAAADRADLIAYLLGETRAGD